MTDAQLIQAAREGDQAAFGTLVARHHARVVAQCVRLAGNRADGEDLAHDAWVEAWLKLDRLAEPAAFVGWLRTVTLNVFRMWYRRRRETVALPEGLAAAAPEHRQEVLHRRLDQGLSALTRTHRAVLVLHYLEGLSYAEIADLLDLPPGTVMSRLYRGRRALAAHLEAPREETAMSTAPDLTQDVLAEIAVLLELHAERPEDPERLSILLERSPERLRGLLEATSDPGLLAAVGALLPRLGPEAFRTVLDAALGEAPAAASAARQVLRATATRIKTLPWGGAPDHSAGPGAYRLAAACIAHPTPAGARAGLLIDLLPGVADGPTRELLTDVLLAFGAPASDRLLAAYQALPAEAGPSWDRSLLQAACRLGTPFAQVLLADLEDPVRARARLALGAVEALGRLLSGAEAGASDRAARLDARHGRGLPPDAVATEVLEALAQAAARLTDVSDPALREAALRSLGALGRGKETVRACLAHPDPTTRVAAIRAAAALGDAAAADGLARLAAEGAPEERRPAVEALGAVAATAHEGLLIELLADLGAPEVQVAAAAALGELDTEGARAALQAALAAGPEARRKAAAKALYRRRPQGRPLMSRRLWTRLRGASAAPVAEVSVEAALRWGLPEPGPLPEATLSQGVGQVCVDVSSVRRKLVQEGFLERADGVYAFTPLGEAAWRVERFVGRALD